MHYGIDQRFTRKTMQAVRANYDYNSCNKQFTFENILGSNIGQDCESEKKMQIPSIQGL